MEVSIFLLRLPSNGHGRVHVSAPVFGMTRGRTKLQNHKMKYFFLATAFFAFHLLLAYLVDHVSIHLAF
jgi:hypothetical protein